MTVKQHFVPKFYLERFTDSSGFLYVYNVEKNKFFKSRPEDICFENFLYETEWKDANPMLGKYILLNQNENHFSTEESKYNSLLDKIILLCDEPKNENALILGAEDKNFLRSFIANMFVRHPKALEDYKEFYLCNESLERKELQIYKKVLEMLKFDGFKSIVEASVVRTCVDDSCEKGNAYNIVKKLESMYFTIMKASNSNFNTSSFPVIYVAESDKLYISLPISPKYLILFTTDKQFYQWRNRIIFPGKDVVSDLNKLYFNFYPGFCKYIISNNQQELEKIIATRDYS